MPTEIDTIIRRHAAEEAEAHCEFSQRMHRLCQSVDQGHRDAIHTQLTALAAQAKRQAERSIQTANSQWADQGDQTRLAWDHRVAEALRRLCDAWGEDTSARAILP
jgi:hypothetical protein